MKTLSPTFTGAMWSARRSEWTGTRARRGPGAHTTGGLKFDNSSALVLLRTFFRGRSDHEIRINLAHSSRGGQVDLRRSVGTEPATHICSVVMDENWEEGTDSDPVDVSVRALPDQLLSTVERDWLLDEVAPFVPSYTCPAGTLPGLRVTASFDVADLDGLLAAVDDVEQELLADSDRIRDLVSWSVLRHPLLVPGLGDLALEASRWDTGRLLRLAACAVHLYGRFFPLHEDLGRLARAAATGDADLVAPMVRTVPDLTEREDLWPTMDLHGAVIGMLRQVLGIRRSSRSIGLAPWILPVLRATVSRGTITRGADGEHGRHPAPPAQGLRLVTEGGHVIERGVISRGGSGTGADVAAWLRDAAR